MLSVRVAVTGANGHLGSTLCKRLIEMGIQTVACARSPAPFATLSAGCDLTSIEALSQSFEGCEVVYHTAAPTQLWSKDARDIEVPIYEGTLNVIRACAKAGVPRIVYSSTCAAVGFRAPDGVPLSEENFNDKTTHPQFRAKLRSELYGARLSEQLGVNFVRVCAPSVVGPGFKRATPSVEPYVMLSKGKLPFVPDLSYSVVDVRDLAESQIWLGMKKPQALRYIVASHYVTTKDLLTSLSQIAPQLKQPAILPQWTLPYLAAIDAAFYYAAFGLKARKITSELVRESRNANQRLNTSRFRNEFQLWSPRPLRETIYDTLAYIGSEHAQ